MPDLLPSRPVLALSASDGWRGVEIQHYRHPPGIVDVPGNRDDLLVAHLAGPVLVEDSRGEGRTERRWTGPGQVSVTPAGQPVRRLFKGRTDVVLIYLRPELARDVASEVFGVDPDTVSLAACLGAPDEPATRIVNLLLAEAETPTPGTGPMTEALARALSVHVLRRYANLARRPAEVSVSMTGGRLRRVIAYMRANLHEPLPLARLARHVGLSSSQFARAFRDATGRPPHRFLVGLRIERARELLESTDRPVIEIALRCGFEQTTHFATMFRQVTGVSPRAWRLSHRS